MTVRFLHAADIHLGYRQYGRQEREDDFARAFREMIGTAIAEKVDFVLLAGDLFHKRTVEARSFIQAAYLLRQLADAGIPVLAIEGNHERPYLSEQLSWLDGLAVLGLLRVLSGDYVDGVLTLAPYDDARNQGAYVDIHGVRIVGQRYSGAATSRILQDLAPALQALQGESDEAGPAHTILMLHIGLQGVLEGYAGTVSHEDLAPLRPLADYVALGHIHKPFEHDDWLYNPGSPENNAVDEAAWQDRGYYIVEVDPERRTHHAHLRRSRRRPVVQHRFVVDAFSSPTPLLAALQRDLGALVSDGEPPILDLRLTGTLAFGRQDLDLAGIQTMAEETVRPLVCLVQDQTSTGTFDFSVDVSLSRAELERRVLKDLIESDSRHRPHADRWADAAMRIKQMALARQSPESIVGELQELLPCLGVLEQEAN